MIPRILLHSEFSQLSTGFSAYCKNLLKGLAESNKYEVAEFATYAQNMNYDLPWKVYGFLPGNDEEKQIYDSDDRNVFGRHMFEQVCLDFRPTHVLSLFDFWYSNWILDSPYRKTFNFVWCPTVDSLQQNKDWYDSYRDVDALLTYTDWSGQVLKDEARLFSHGQAPMSCSEYFVPMNKEEVKKSFGINPEIKIVGFVGRNQKRKLYAELFESFRQFLDETKRQDVVLWIHTAYPDLNGWDFPKLTQKYDLGGRLWMTYTCNCGVKPMPFSGAKQFCSRCRWEMVTSNVGGVIPDFEMARIYNAFDYYVQPVSNEGFGCPVIEAAACGVHGCATNYSATEDITSKLDFDKLDFKTVEEIETGRLIAIPDRNDLVKKMTDFLALPGTFRNLAGQKARQNYVKHYSWSKTVEKWMSVIDNLPPKTHTDPDIQRPAPFREGLTNGAFIKWGILYVLCQPERLGTLFEAQLVEDLNFGYKDKHPFNQKMAYDMFLGMRNRINHFENLRKQHETVSNSPQ